MTAFVVDANIVAKWFLPEQHHELARALLSPRNHSIAPDQVLVELANALVRRCHSRTLTVAEAGQALDLLMQYPLDLRSTSSVIADAVKPAASLNRLVYDCVYLGLALQLNIPLVTADRKPCNSLSSGPFADVVVWIEDTLRS